MANLSSVITQTVGNSSGGVNLITAPSQSSIWTATGLTLSTTTTAAELPLEGFSSSAVKFLLTGSTTSAYVDFLVPTALAQTKLGLQWYARADVTTIGSITLSLSSYASAGNRTSNTSPTTVTLQTSSVASAATSFNTTFDTASQQYYRLTLNFPASASNWYTLAQFVLGPGIINQGAAVGPLGSFTSITTQGFGTPSSITVEYFRDGTRLRGIGRFTMGTSTAVEARLTFPLSLTCSLPANTVIGTWTRTGTGAGTIKSGVLFSTNAQAYANWGFVSDDAVSSPMTASVGSNVAGSGETITFEFDAPVSEWAGNGTVNLGAGAQVEYAYNSDVTNANATASGFAYGPSGTVFGSFSTANRIKRVRFQYPIQTDDAIQLEVFQDSAWYPAETSFAMPLSSTTGTFIKPVSGTTTDVDVYFGSAGYPATLQGVSGAWSDVAANTNYKWRVRKSSASAPVGFGLAGTDGSSGLVNPYTEGSGVVYAARYTPVATASTNVSSATPYSSHYTRVGKIVTVSGVIDLPTTTATNTASVLFLSLPIASNLTSSIDLSGSGSRTAASGTAYAPVAISADTTNDRARFDFNSTSTSTTSLSFTFQYEIK